MTDLADRYGTRRRRGAVAVALAAVLALAFGAWLAWATWSYAGPDVRSDLAGWQVTGDHEVTARVEVGVADPGTVATCVVRALAADHTVVGERSFEVTTSNPDVVEVRVRTERRATAVELRGCTTPDQPRPR